MSNGRTHRRIGTLVGGACAFAKAQHEHPAHRLLEVLGGLAAGNLGARRPDVLDPPIHPRHRSLAHGVVPVGAAGCAAVRYLDRAQASLRSEAVRRAQLHAAATSQLESIWHALLAILCRLGSGALAGFLAGYGSHIALDTLSPAGLPLVA